VKHKIVNRALKETELSTRELALTSDSRTVMITCCSF
jgi:hypothetical protein